MLPLRSVKVRALYPESLKLFVTLDCPNMCNQCSDSQTCIVCAENFYINDGQCDTCDSTCHSCNGATSNNCLGCSADLKYDPVLQTCASSCTSGKFYDENTQECNPCSLPCAECETSSTQCTSCPQSKFLLENTCVDGCLAGQYGAAGLCSNCSTECNTCSQSASNCMSCSGPLNLDGVSCVGSCPAGKFAQNNVCTPCDASCGECSTSATSCTKCSTGTYLKETSCVTDCGTGFYSNTTTCLTCDTTCATCSGANANECLSCGPGLKFDPIANNCSASCAINKYFDSTAGNCQRKPLLVFSLLSFVNAACSSNCNSCDTSATQCLTCEAGQVLLTDQTCSSGCPDGEYANNGVCKACDTSCTTCNGGTNKNCLSCAGSLYFDGIGSCVTVCPNGFFQGANNLCPACTANVCATCTESASNCVTCPSGKRLLSNGNTTMTCVDTCPVAFFEKPDGLSCSSELFIHQFLSSFHSRMLTYLCDVQRLGY